MIPRVLSPSQEEEQWIQYWENNPAISSWHAMTVGRHTQDSAILSLVPKLEDFALGSNGCATEHEGTCMECCDKVIYIQSRVQTSARPLTLLSLVTSSELVTHFSYRIGIASVQVSSSDSYQRALKILQTQCDVSTAVGKLWRLIPREDVAEYWEKRATSNEFTFDLPPKHIINRPAELLLVGTPIGVFRRRLINWKESLKRIFSVFGPCRILEQDLGSDGSNLVDRCVVQYTRTSEESVGDGAAEDAKYALRSLQNFFAVDWGCCLCFVGEKMKPPGPSPSKPRGICPRDGKCPDVNNEVHQQMFLHHCTLPSPCPYRDHQLHGPFFIH